MSSLKRKGVTIADSAELKRPKKDGTLTSFFGAPKPAVSKKQRRSTHGSVPGLRSSNSTRTHGCHPEARTKRMLKLEIDTLDSSWLAQLKEELISTSFLNLKRFCKRRSIRTRQFSRHSRRCIVGAYCLRSKSFSDANLCTSRSRNTPLHTVKVVVLVRSYHRVQSGPRPILLRPTSYTCASFSSHIYKALKHDYPSWAALRTRRPANALGESRRPYAEHLSHCTFWRSQQSRQSGWETFTQKVIDIVVRVRSRGVVFLAWGNPAQKDVQVSRVQSTLCSKVYIPAL